jgi:DNA-binding MarR family transcriptional regulator
MANTSPDDAELEHLLTQLLRMVSPAFSTDDAGARSQPAPGPVKRRVPSSLSAAAVGAPRLHPSVGEPPVPAGEAAASAGETAASAPTSVPAARPASAGEPGTAGGPLPIVSSSEARALIELVAARGIAQGELAGLLGLDKSTVSRLAAGLERKGWVSRGRDEENQRYVRLYLTPQGGAVAARVWQAWQSRQARILAALSAEERAGLAAGLGGLVRGLAAEGLRGEPTGNGA